MSTLSERGNWTKDFRFYLIEYLAKCNANLYNEKSNKHGIVNLGTAENGLCEDLMTEKFNSINEFSGWMQYYFDWTGTPTFRGQLARFIDSHFKSCKSINADNLIVTNGAAAAIDLLGYAFADEGDAFLMPAPYFTGIAAHVAIRSRMKIIPAYTSASGDHPFQASAKLLESAYLKATAKGERVRGIVLVNPDNPTGQIMSGKTLLEILNFAKRYALHVIVDEIYGLSVYEKDADFQSVLSFNHVPDPERTHWVWAFSKDIAVSGMRCGVIHSLNPDLKGVAKRNLIFGSVPAWVQGVLGKLIDDTEWLDSTFLPTNLKRTQEAAEYSCRRLEDMGVKVRPAESTLFIWADFSSFLKSTSPEAEMELFDEFMESGVYIIPGKLFHCQHPGWFRVTVTLPRHQLKVGLDRVEKVLDAVRPVNEIIVYHL